MRLSVHVSRSMCVLPHRSMCVPPYVVYRCLRVSVRARVLCSQKSVSQSVVHLVVNAGKRTRVPRGGLAAS